MIYIGAHTTHDINDGYMGSGVQIKIDIKKYKIENFDKKVLYQFDNLKEMFDKERELVNESFISRRDTYNVILGGGGFLTIDTVSIKDKDGNFYRVHKTDPRYVSGELVGVTKGKISVKDDIGNVSNVSLNDPKYLSGELVGIAKGKVNVKDKNNNFLQVYKEDPRYLSGELVPVNMGKVNIKDKNGSNFQVDINDDRYLSGELVGVTFNETHKQETKDKIGKKASLRVGNKNSMFGKKQTNEMKDKVRDKLSIKFFVYDIDGNFLSEEKGINEYAKSNDFNPSSIVKVLKGRYKNTSNLKFFYSFQGDKLK